jgi:hypothetical protein
MRPGTVRYRQDDRIEGIAYSPDGRRLVTGMSDTTVLIWDPGPRD